MGLKGFTNTIKKTIVSHQLEGILGVVDVSSSQKKEIKNILMDVLLKIEKESSKPKPKRPLSAYMHFSKEMQTKAPYSTMLPIGDRAKAIGKKWKTMSESEKKKYYDLAEAEKKKMQSGGARKKSTPKRKVTPKKKATPKRKSTSKSKSSKSKSKSKSSKKRK